MLSAPSAQRCKHTQAITLQGGMCTGCVHVNWLARKETMNYTHTHTHTRTEASFTLSHVRHFTLSQQESITLSSSVTWQHTSCVHCVFTAHEWLRIPNTPAPSVAEERPPMAADGWGLRTRSRSPPPPCSSFPFCPPLSCRKPDLLIFRLISGVVGQRGSLWARAGHRCHVGKRPRP